MSNPKFSQLQQKASKLSIKQRAIAFSAMSNSIGAIITDPDTIDYVKNELIASYEHSIKLAETHGGMPTLKQLSGRDV